MEVTEAELQTLYTWVRLLRQQHIRPAYVTSGSASVLQWAATPLRFMGTHAG